MRIGLDYYRILGLPLAASWDQLQQAYSDRIVQLPRREYSSAAIASRKKLIEEAYVVLSDPKERKAYDRVYLAHAYDPEGNNGAASTVAVENRLNDHQIDTQNVSIDISPTELIGALMVLQELGEYELVLKLGRPYLVNNIAAIGGHEGAIAHEELNQQRPDVVLTVALACLELGREQWQQGNYENAGVSLETGLELLQKEQLFPNVQTEIEADIYRLRPYRILELIASSEDQTAERQQGLQLLQDILDERGGIDGTGDDHSGLNIDDFLRFIQQLRHHMSVAEQHKLFEYESQRPSSVATYLAVYALIARGFTQFQPALIRQAKQMLAHLAKRQDVHLEQSLCCLLLGQTEQASRAVELSQEYEALASIREHSQDSPDLLPGLCYYGEQWLQNEVFPHFRDLKDRQASLKDYFAEEQVQAYLDSLPIQSNDTQGIQSASGSRPSPSLDPPPTSSVVYGKFPPQPSQSLEDSHNLPPQGNNDNAQVPRPTTTADSHPDAVAPAPRVRRRRPNPVDLPNRREVPRQGVVRRRYRRRNPQSKMRLLWVVLGTAGGIFVLSLLLTTTFGLLRNLFDPRPTLEGQPLAVKLNEAPVEIPTASSKILSGLLTKETALDIVQTWLTTKAAALGRNHDTESLDEILTGPSLASWRLIANQDKSSDRYRTFQHNIKIESLNSQTGGNQATVDAIVTEEARIYDSGQINQQKSYKDTLRVRYILSQTESGWRIREMSVLNKIN